MGSLPSSQTRVVCPAVNNSYAQAPGSAGRWILTSDESGLTSMAAMYSTVNKLANDTMLYNSTGHTDLSTL